jgi:hypothetical protein
MNLTIKERIQVAREISKLLKVELSGDDFYFRLALANHPELLEPLSIILYQLKERREN